jgi:hypothetical protein
VLDRTGRSQEGAERREAGRGAGLCPAGAARRSGKLEWARLGSNQGPPACEPGAGEDGRRQTGTVIRERAQHERPLSPAFRRATHQLLTTDRSAADTASRRLALRMDAARVSGSHGSGGLLNVMRDTQYGGAWLSGKVFWYVLPSYRGPVLVRGRQLSRRLMGPRTELRIHTYDTVSWSGQQPGSRGIPSGVGILKPGCYGVQIDGTRFRWVVVFEVIYWA